MRPTALAPALLACGAALLLADSASASGVLEKLTLEQAVARAQYVLVVEQASPPEQRVEKTLSYLPEGSAEPKTHVNNRALARMRVVEVLYSEPEHRPAPGAVISVLSTDTLIAETDLVIALSGGPRPIHIYPAMPRDVGMRKGRRFLALLGQYDPSDRHFVGVAALGLLSMRDKAAVVRLAKTKRQAP